EGHVEVRRLPADRVVDVRARERRVVDVLRLEAQPDQVAVDDQLLRRTADARRAPPDPDLAVAHVALRELPGLRELRRGWVLLLRGVAGHAGREQLAPRSTAVQTTVADVVLLGAVVVDGCSEARVALNGAVRCVRREMPRCCLR